MVGCDTVCGICFELTLNRVPIADMWKMTDNVPISIGTYYFRVLIQ